MKIEDINSFFSEQVPTNKDLKKKWPMSPRRVEGAEWMRNNIRDMEQAPD